MVIEPNCQSARQMLDSRGSFGCNTPPAKREMRRDLGRKHGLLTGPRFLWPSLGRPFFLSADEPAFTAFVAAPAGSLDALELRGGYRLTSVQDPRLAIVPAAEVVGKAAALPEGSPLLRVLIPRDHYAFYEVRLEVPAESAAAAAGDRRYLLFDLSHPRVATSPHALAWLNHRWERYTFVFAADTHLAEVWDHIEADFLKLESGDGMAGGEPPARLRRAFSRKSFADNFVNPNRQWQAFIREANRRGGQGDLDFIILGGDLVDYQFPKNFELFEDMVTGRVSGSAALEVPLFTVPGNHDYRRFPYRIQAYPLDRCGLHELQRDFFLRQARGERRRRLSIGDARAVLAGDGGRHPLAQYLLHINPVVDYALKVGRSRFVFLDTGRDAFRDVLHVRPRRWGNYLRSTVHSWFFPNSAGLKEGQAAFLAREAEDDDLANLIIVFHAGLVGGPVEGRRRRGGRPEARAGRRPADPAGEDELPLPLKESLRAEDSLRTRIRLEKALVGNGLGRGGLFQNQLSLFQAAAAGGRAALGLSGHFHRPVGLRLDKRSAGLFLRGSAAEGPIASSFEDSSYFLAGPALGHVNPRADPPGRPGFTRIDVAGDRIASVREEPLRASPQDFVRVHAQGPDGDTAWVSVITELEGPGVDLKAGNFALDITFFVFSRPSRGVPGGFPFAIEAESPNGAQPGKPRWIGRADRKAFLGGAGPAYVQDFRCEFRREWRFLFLPVGRLRGRPTAVVIAEILARREGGWTPVSLKWYPLSIRVARAAGAASISRPSSSRVDDEGS